MAKKTYTQAEVNKLLAEARNNIVITQETQKVTLVYIGAIARGTVVALGRLGTISRAGIAIDVPKDAFLKSLGVPVVDALLRKRKLIVVNGLDNDERLRFGLLYEEGELLNTNTFFKILDLSQKEICELFKKLCKDHKEIVAKMYLEAYFEKHDNRVHIETVKELNDISKEFNKNGMFKLILQDYGNKLAE